MLAALGSLQLSAGWEICTSLDQQQVKTSP